MMHYVKLIAMLNIHSNSLYEEVNTSNYPDIHTAIQDEARFRSITPPDIYMDHTGDTRLAYANRHSYAIFIDPDIVGKFNDQELRALAAHEIRHLFQKDYKNNEESREHEFECDRAAIESTNIETYQSYVHKAVEIMIGKVVPKALQGLAQTFHDAHPNLIAENFWVRLDAQHPSPANRLQAATEYSRQIHRDITPAV